MGVIRQFSGRLLLLGALAGGLGAGAYHRTPLDALESTNLPPSLILTNAPRRIAEGVYSLGLVRMDKAKRTISFPGSVNMCDGLVEYALVQTTGKVHESILKTQADPLHIHLASLLLASSAARPPVAQVGRPRDLVGPKVEIWVSWRTQGGTERVPIENLVSNVLTRARMSRGDWIYSGSRIVEGTFLAQRDGSIVAIIADPDALVNNPRPGRDDDEIWKPNAGLVPAVGTPVEVTIQLEKDS